MSRRVRAVVMPGPRRPLEVREFPEPALRRSDYEDEPAPPIAVPSS